MEAAVTHGYLGARVKGYADQRQRGRSAPAGKPLSDFASKFAKYGFVAGGASADGPVH